MAAKKATKKQSTKKGAKKVTKKTTKKATKKATKKKGAKKTAKKATKKRAKRVDAEDDEPSEDAAPARRRSSASARSDDDRSAEAERDGSAQDDAVESEVEAGPRAIPGELPFEADDSDTGSGEAPLSKRAEKRRRWKERRQRRRNKDREGTGADAPEAVEDEVAADAREWAREEPPARDAAAPTEPSPWEIAKQRKAQGRTRREAPASVWEKRPATGFTTKAAGGAAGARDVEGVLVLEKMNHGHLRSAENRWFATKQDPHVSPQLVQRLGLREGSLIRGRVRRGQGRHKVELSDVLEVDGQDPRKVRNVTPFKKLTSIDPDFHYAVGDGSGEVSLKVVDILCPIGRGQRGLIVAPPRSGKTILLQQFAHAIEDIYPEVRLMVLLVDERPEEATEWQRALKTGEVYVSTNDEPPKRHVELSEVVAARAKRLVELGEDVILLLDSITRMGRAYNNVYGNSGKTMSGGIDSRALERPKQFFGAARNTEKAGSLTILGTTLVETGSRMDQVIFEEFKGTGNMELVLARRLADRRIFPAIDVERSGTRKEEKLLSSTRHRRCSTLRRVLMRMHWAEAMELLITKLENVEKIDDFLQRFDIDPEA